MRYFKMLFNCLCAHTYILSYQHDIIVGLPLYRVGEATRLEGHYAHLPHVESRGGLNTRDSSKVSPIINQFLKTDNGSLSVRQ